MRWRAVRRVLGMVLQSQFQCLAPIERHGIIVKAWRYRTLVLMCNRSDELDWNNETQSLRSSYSNVRKRAISRRAVSVTCSFIDAAIQFRSILETVIKTITFNIHHVLQHGYHSVLQTCTSPDLHVVEVL
jgi:hypothetical protein